VQLTKGREAGQEFLGLRQVWHKWLARIHQVLAFGRDNMSTMKKGLKIVNNLWLNSLGISSGRAIHPLDGPESITKAAKCKSSSSKGLVEVLTLSLCL
jgi:hypothetical protein